MKSYLCLHYHHGVLGEFVTESVADRIAFNRAMKDPAELETRERLIQAVPEELLTPLLLKAWEAWEARKVWKVWKAREAWEAREVWEAQKKARKVWEAREKVWEKAWGEAQPDLIALHAKLCVADCPWDGKTIFPPKPI